MTENCKKTIRAMMAAVAVLFAAGCSTSGNSTQVYLDGSESEITAKAGEQFVVGLNGNPTTGYQWNLVSDEALDGLGAFEGSTYDSSAPKGSNICGAPGVFKFAFTAKKPGNCVLKFVYKRSWEKTESDVTREIRLTIIE